MADDLAPQGQVLIYADVGAQLQVRLDGQTVWLTQRLMAELYQVSVKTVSEHLTNIYAEDELEPGATIRKFRIVQSEGTRSVSRLLDHYNLDAILAVGYRVRSPRGTQFRQWATARLSELLVKGFTLDDERIKAGQTIGALHILRSHISLLESDLVKETARLFRFRRTRPGADQRVKRQSKCDTRLFIIARGSPLHNREACRRFELMHSPQSRCS